MKVGNKNIKDIMNMKRITNWLILSVCFAVLYSCAPDYDNELGPVLDPSTLQYSVTQEEGYDNKIFLQSLTPGVIPYWDYELGTSNELLDTVILPFKGDFWVKYRAMAAGGSSIDSTMISVSQFDPNYFADPVWQNLTNGELGRTWKLVAVRAGDAKSTTYSDWGDASWVTADFGDSAHFDLDKGFNFIRYTDGVATKSTFNVDTNEVLTDAYLDSPGKALIINGGNKMPANDPSNEMLPNLKNRFRIFKVSNDTLVLGQGAYYTGDPSGTWTYWHWYLRTN
jgi:hypothetical protein